MKNVARVISLIIVVFFLVASVAFSGERNLRVVGSWSSLTMYKNFEKPLWTETLPKALGGNIKTSMTSLGQVKLKGAAVLRQMNMGVFDVVYTVADYVVSDCPALAGLDLPTIAPDIELARKVVAAYRPTVAKYLEKDFDAKLISIAPYPAQVLFSRVKITGLDDLKGKKIRASGWTTSQFVKALGATGITMSFGEVPQALQRGVVDCAITGSLSGYMAGWGEVAKYIYPLPMGGWDYIIGSMNMNTWKSFSPEEQKKILTLSKEKLEIPAWNVTAKETQEGIDCLIGGKCAYGNPNSLVLIKVRKNDLKRAHKVLEDDVLPAWASKVDPEVVKRWNETIGKVVGLTAK